MRKTTKAARMSTRLNWWGPALGSVLAITVLTTLFPPQRAAAQDDQQDDPPTRVARLGYMEGSVSFLPAGETDWVGAVPNRPMTTGDKLWADKDSRAELQLGSAMIRLSENTGFSFLNLDDHTVQIQLTSGTLNIRVRRLGPDDDVEIDTPNLAFTVSEPGSYRAQASEDGTYTVVGIRDGGGQATGNGQTYTLHAGQRATFSGTDSLNAEVEEIGNPDQFDNWAYARDHRYDISPSAHYLSQDVVGYEDLDQNGDWRDDPNYGHVWFPHIEAGWAPYHTGHWDWIPPWGYTWVDDFPWGYAPFHYGRWVVVGGSWGWIAGPPAVAAVYAPALVVFIGGGPGGWGGNVGWFPLGPREVYIPPYQVSRGYMTQVNISNTVVNTTVITNVYNTTIINKTTNITNITYANRSVQGAVMVVPQRAFASAQPVAHVAVSVNAQQLASAPVSARVAVVPTQQAVLGAKASTAGHVSAPPAAVMNRQVIAKKTPPPPPVPFAKQQQALAAHPGQAVAPRELQSLRPTGAAARPMVKQAPPGKPATPTTGHPANQPSAARPGQPAPPPANQPANQPMNRPPTQPANRPPTQPAPSQRPSAPTESNHPPATQPNRPAPPQPNNRPENNRPDTNRPTPPPEPNRPPAAQQNNRPAQPNNAEPSRPQTTRPAEPPAPNNRPPGAQPNNRPETARPEAKPQPAPRPQTPPPAERQPQRTPPPAEAKPAQPPAHQQPKQTPQQKKEEDEKKKPEKPPGQ
jgi:hypothetical protein